MNSMKLLYFYIKDFGCFKNREFNFDSRHRFHLEYKGNDEYILKHENGDMLPDNFFSTNDSDLCPVQSVSAVIGPNGSGKTTIARALAKLRLNINHMYEHVIVYEIDGQLICRYHLLKKITSEILEKHHPKNPQPIEPVLSQRQVEIFEDYLSTPCRKRNKKIEDLPDDDSVYKQAYDFFTLNSDNYKPSGKKIVEELYCNLTSNMPQENIIRWIAYGFTNSIKNNFGLMYYSPMYTTEYHFESENFIDLSTTRCLATGPGTRSEYYQNSSSKLNILPTDAHKAYEYKWALKFFSALRNKQIKIDEFCANPPKGLLISPEQQLQDIALNDLKTLREKHRGDLSKEISTLELDQRKQIYELTDRIIKAIIKKHTDDFFVNAFICYFACYCRDHLSGTINLHDAKLQELILKPIVLFLDFLENIEKDMPPFQNPQNMADIYDKILQILEAAKDNAYSLFKSLKTAYLTYLKNNFSNVVLPHLWCNCSTEDGLSWTCDFIDYYFQSVGITNFLKFSYDPHVSSGEMAFVSMFSRIYEKLQSRSDTLPDELLFFIDEAETALHPEWQLKLVKLSIKFWEIFAPDKKIHLLFSSHSPMLLSDIPVKNVVFLPPKGTQATGGIFTSFGSNVFDLYKNSFFLSDGTIGKFAQDKIQLLLNVVNERKNDGQDLDPQKKELKENQDKFNYLVSLIGDTNIREYLYRKYAECCCSEKTAKIRQYEQIIVSLKNMEETND